MPPTMDDRFWSKVAFGREAPFPLGRCWEWQAAKRDFGYGAFWDGRHMEKAHRASWKLTFGLIPDTLCVLHRCDNPPCVRPNHLFLGTHADNVADMHRKNRGNVGERNGKAILRLEQVRTIRAMLATGLTQQAIAEEFGVARATVQLIAAGKNWRTY